MTEEERKVWLKRRREGIGSSDMAALFGLDPWRTAWHCYLDKIGELPDEDSPQKEWGRRLEDVVAFAYEKEMGVVPITPPPGEVVEHRSLPYLLATPDRYVMLGDEKAVLELKTAGYAHDEWGIEGTDQIPEAYLLQVQHQLLVTGLRLAHVAVLFGVHDFRWYVIEANDQIHQKIVARATAFWENNVVNRTPPEPDWLHGKTLSLIKSLYTEVRPIPNIVLHLDELVRQYRHLKEAANTAEKESDVCKAQLLEAMGCIEEARTPGGYRLRRKSIHADAYSVGEKNYVKLYITEPKGV